MSLGFNVIEEKQDIVEKSAACDLCCALRKGIKLRAEAF